MRGAVPGVHTFGQWGYPIQGLGRYGGAEEKPSSMQFTSERAWPALSGDRARAHPREHPPTTGSGLPVDSDAGVSRPALHSSPTRGVSQPRNFRGCEPPLAGVDVDSDRLPRESRFPSGGPTSGMSPATGRLRIRATRAACCFGWRLSVIQWSTHWRADRPVRHAVETKMPELRSCMREVLPDVDVLQVRSFSATNHVVGPLDTRGVVLKHWRWQFGFESHTS